METIIKCAIEGGCEFLSEWKKFQIIIGGVGLYDEGENFVKRIGSGSLMPIEQVLMQKEFWQALGKSCGWKERDFDFYEVDREQEPFYLNTYRYYALRFHEINLTEGWDSAIAYLTNLIKS